MMHCKQFIHNDIEFWMYYGSVVNGVVIDQTASLDDPEYIRSLQTAIKVYTAWSDFCFYMEQSTQIEFLNAEKFTKSIQEIVYRVPEFKLTPHDICEIEQRVLKIQGVITPQKKKLSSRDGYVYLIQSPTSAYKIGRSSNPDARIATFEVKLPFEVEFICSIQTSDMYALETTLHNLFADKRINGEWFALESEDVEYIKSMAVQS